MYFRNFIIVPTAYLQHLDRLPTMSQSVWYVGVRLQRVRTSDPI